MFNTAGISSKHCLTKFSKQFPVPGNLLFKTTQYTVNHNILDLTVRNCKPVAAVTYSSTLGKIPGHKKCTPEIVGICIQILICDHLINVSVNIVSIYQTFQFILYKTARMIHTVYQMVNHIITACIHPVIFHPCIWIPDVIPAIINDIPWAIYICISETITVVPFFYITKMTFKSIITEYLSDFIIRKSKRLIKILICDRVY